jgi:peptidylprolyl isomerase
MRPARHGDTVKIHYIGRNERGDVVDTTEGGPPHVARVGSGDLVAGLNAALSGMEVGEARTITVRPENGYGRRKKGTVHRVPLDMLPEQANLGDKLFARTVDKELVEVWITGMDAEEATLDENHPLAGQTIEYVLKLVEVVAA